VGENTTISWCRHTFNPWIGCTKVHEGCAHCYAERDMAVRMQRVHWGPNGTRSVTKTWNDPLKWNRQAPEDGERRRVFCASLADVFEEWNGDIVKNDGQTATRLGGRKATMADLRRDLFTLIDSTPMLDWLILTKRPENIFNMWPVNPRTSEREFRSNVWIGTSVSTQETAQRMVPHLQGCRQLSPVLFLSIEPLLSKVVLSDVVCDFGGGFIGNPFECKSGGGYEERRWPAIDWIIVGGESGPLARPCHEDWIRSICNECMSHNVPCFVKQLGQNALCRSSLQTDERRLWSESLKGGNPVEWPQDLRVREFPDLDV
jgi:protein gp37